MFLYNRRQRVLLNGQSSDWKLVKVGVPQGPVLGPLLFLIYINNLPLGLFVLCQVFSWWWLFLIVNCSKASSSVVNSNLLEIKVAHVSWRCRLIQTTPNKVKLYFRQRAIYFNNEIVKRTHTKAPRSSSTKGLFRKLQPILPRRSLLTINKSLIRPHLNYDDVIYDQPSNASF